MRRSGFTFYELIICVVVMAIIAVGALPDSRAKMTQEADLAGDQFETDVGFAKSLSISDPSDPALIKIDRNSNRYWVARKSAPDTPVTHPLTKQPYIVQFGTTGKTATNHVQITGSDAGSDQVIQFTGTGGLDETTDAILQFTAGQAKCEVSVSPNNSRVSTSPVFTANLSSGGTTAVAGE